MGFFIGTDVGGTFTDMWVAEPGKPASVIKSPTTPDVMGGVLECARLAAEAAGLSFEQFCSRIERFGHGTTVGLNALLTGASARTAVITTSGFGDTLQIGRMRRQTAGLSETEVCNWLLHERYAPLVARNLVIEVQERINANGNVIKPLDEDHARRQIAALRDRAQPIEAVAVCTLWSCSNPDHEIALRRILEQELPNTFVTLSHQISPVVGEYARMCTTVANAVLGPIAGRYLSKLEGTLQAAGMKVPILMMTSAGGVLPAHALNDRPAVAIFSGPAGGVMGSIATGKQRGHDNILAVDIGGTSFDVGVIASGKPMMRSSISLAGADISVPSIDVSSLGAGGGSIASVQFGDLTVGPESAGSTPGPACYGRGGVRPTSTDADLVLGVLDAKYFIGGRMTLDIDKARAAIEEHVARPLGLDVISAAWGIREVLDHKMADLLRRITIERGYDPRDFIMLANGGAGPSHAWVLARELGLSGFIVPAAATVQSAFGTANSDLGVTVTKPVYVRITGANLPKAQELAQLTDNTHAALDECAQALSSAAASDLSFETTLAIRYRGQTHHLDIAVPITSKSRHFDKAAYQKAIDHFEVHYNSLFGEGAGSAAAGFEILSVRVIGKGALPVPSFVSNQNTITAIGTRDVVFDDPKSPVRTTIYRSVLPPANTPLQGPCIVEYPGQSAVVPPGATAEADIHGNLEVRFQQ